MQVWIAPSTGVATAFLDQLGNISSDSTALMIAIFAVFALVHSGLAYLRPYGEQSSAALLDNQFWPPQASLCPQFLLLLMPHHRSTSNMCLLYQRVW